MKKSQYVWSNNLVTISIVVGLSSTVAFFLFDLFSANMPFVVYGVLSGFITTICGYMVATKNKLSELIGNKSLTSSERDRLIPQIKAREHGYIKFALLYFSFAIVMTGFVAAFSKFGGYEDTYGLQKIFDPLMIGICFAAAYSFLVHQQDMSEVNEFIGTIEDRLYKSKLRDEFVAKRKKKAS